MKVCLESSCTIACWKSSYFHTLHTCCMMRISNMCVCMEQLKIIIHHTYVLWNGQAADHYGERVTLGLLGRARQVVHPAQQAAMSPFSLTWSSLVNDYDMPWNAYGKDMGTWEQQGNDMGTRKLHRNIMGMSCEYITHMKEGSLLFCFVCTYEIHRTGVLQIVFLVSLESSQQGGCIGLVSWHLELRV